MVVELLLRAKQTKQTIKSDYTTCMHYAHAFPNFVTDLPSILHVGRLLSQKVRNKFLKNQSEKFL